MARLPDALKTYLTSDATLMATASQVLDMSTVSPEGLKLDDLMNDASDNPFGDTISTIYIKWSTITRTPSSITQDERGFVEFYFYANTYTLTAIMRERVRVLLKDGTDIQFTEPSDGWQAGFTWVGGDILYQSDPNLANVRFERSRYQFMNLRELC